MNLSFNITKYTGVMAFYAVITYLLFPAVAYFMFGKKLEAAVVLWKFYGFGMVKGA
jgi:hypothetical protein